MPSSFTSTPFVTPLPGAVVYPLGTTDLHTDPVPAHDFETRMLHLVAWPQLARLPAHEQATVARLCALLARRPTAGSLVPVLLDRDRGEVFGLIARLRQSGHLLVGGEHAVHPAHDNPLAVAEVERPHDSLLEPLWRRLGLHL